MRGLVFSLLPIVLVVAMPPQQEVRSVMVSGFDRIRVDGPIRVSVTDGSPGVRVLGSRAAIEGVEVRVESRTLVISPSVNQWGGVFPGQGRGAMTVEVSARALTGASLVGGGSLAIQQISGSDATVALNGSGAIEVGRIDARRLSATLTGSGRMALAGQAGEARLINRGAGELDAGDLVVDTLMLRSESAGSTRVTGRYRATVYASGSGDVTVQGSPDCKVRGNAPVRCGKTSAGDRARAAGS